MSDLPIALSPWETAPGVSYDYNTAHPADFGGPRVTSPAAGIVPSSPGRFDADTGYGTVNGVTNTDAFVQTKKFLDGFGLGGLTDWAINQLRNGATPDQIALNLRTTPEYQQRFSAITARQKAGLPPISEAEVVAYENTAAQLAQTYGLPKGFLDSGAVTSLIANDVSAAELDARLKDGFDQVEKSDPAVRQAFSDYYGVSGDGALASWFIDPDKAEPLLIQQAQAATLGGNASRYGVKVSQNQAMTLAQAGVSAQRADAAYQQIANLAPLFQQEVGEADKPSFTTTDAVQARLLGSPDQLDAERQRLSARTAAATGKVGVEENPTKGFEGFGAALG